MNLVLANVRLVNQSMCRWCRLGIQATTSCLNDVITQVSQMQESELRALRSPLSSSPIVLRLQPRGIIHSESSAPASCFALGNWAITPRSAPKLRLKVWNASFRPPPHRWSRSGGRGHGRATMHHAGRQLHARTIGEQHPLSSTLPDPTYPSPCHKLRGILGIWRTARDNERTSGRRLGRF